MTKIINLSPSKKSDRASLEIVNNERCQHKHLLIDAKTRETECANCGAKIDAFDTLLMLTDKESAIRRDFDSTRKKLADLKEHYSGLWRVLRKRARYKCRWCGKSNEAVGKKNYQGEVVRAEFSPVTED